MRQIERKKILQQVIWDYNIPLDAIDALITGKSDTAGHYTREQLFVKILETFPWYTIINLFSISDIRLLLNKDLIASLKSPSLRKHYEFIRARLQDTLPASG